MPAHFRSMLQFSFISYTFALLCHHAMHCFVCVTVIFCKPHEFLMLIKKMAVAAAAMKANITGKSEHKNKIREII